MNLIYLHGPPASGKFSIAKEISSKLGCGIFHNHLTIDAAKPFFPFGTSQFWSLVQELRLTAIRVAANNGTKLVIYTSCYDHPHDLAFVNQLEQVLQAAGGKLIPVYLECKVTELEKRVTSTSRAELGKLTDIKQLRQKLETWNCVAIPLSNCITISTSSSTALECAEKIICALGLKL